jgi:hypothetical protein
MAAASQAFELAADELERATALARVAARSALRAALARALYDPAEVGAGPLRRVVELVLPAELAAAGVKDADSACQRIAARLADARLEAAEPESPDEVFGRLIRR